MSVVVAYITGHGYGHFTRAAAVLARLAGTRAVTIHLRTGGRALALAREGEAPWAASVTEVDVGPGVVQRGPLAIDVAATRTMLEAHLRAWPRLVEEEARAIGALGADLVFADIPPIAFAAAARAGVPSLGLANFSWSWIYEGYAIGASEPRSVDRIGGMNSAANTTGIGGNGNADPDQRDPGEASHPRHWFADAAARMAEAEAACTELLALEMGGGLEHFPRRYPIAPAARWPTRPPQEIRAELDSRFAPGDDRPLVLASFGGFGAELDLARALDNAGDLRLLVVAAQVPAGLDHARSIAPTAALPHQDLIAAVDCVVGKPGYGTVAECLVRPTPMVHVPRGDFREIDALVAAIQRWLPSTQVPIEALVEGRWSDAIHRAMSAHPPERAPACEGIAQAAARIGAWLDGMV